MARSHKVAKGRDSLEATGKATMAHIASKVLRRSICTRSQRVVHWHLPTSARLFNFNFTATVRPGSAVQHSGDRRSPASPAQPTLAPAVRGVEQLVYRAAYQHTLPCRLGHQHGQKARELCWSVGEKSAHERAEEARKAARVLTVPNVICVVRIAATPGIAWLLVSGYHDIAFYGFIAAGISDGEAHILPLRLLAALHIAAATLCGFFSLYDRSE